MKTRKNNISVNVLLSLINDGELVYSEITSDINILETVQYGLEPTLTFYENFKGNLEVFDNLTSAVITAIQKQSQVDMDVRTQTLFYNFRFPVFIIEEQNTSAEDIEKIKNIRKSFFII